MVKYVFLFTESCTTVVCSFTMDNVVDSATYGGNELTITGALDDYLGDSTKVKSVTFESCYESSPGTLYIKGSNANGTGCLLVCS